MRNEWHIMLLLCFSCQETQNTTQCLITIAETLGEPQTYFFFLCNSALLSFCFNRLGVEPLKALQNNKSVPETDPYNLAFN